MKLTPLDHWIGRKISAGTGQPSRAEIEAWQLQQLNETIRLARHRSAFYRNHFAGLPEKLDSLQDLAQFPFTTPEDVRRNPLRFVCVSQDDIQRVVTLQSSGTTGEPKRLYFTAADQELTIDFFGVGMNTLTEPGERVLIFLPGETPGSVGDLLRLGLERQGRIPLPYGPIRDPQHALQAVNEQKAGCLVGSPTQILGLARRSMTGMHKPRTVLLSTDHVPGSIKKFLEETWDCKVFNHYGATEMGLGGGVECEAHRGYHLREADLLFEIIDPDTGIILPEGKDGEVVISTLTRRGMPLIRYRMGDSSRFLAGPCPCGTNLRTMEIVRGRFSGYLKINGGELRLPEFDEVLFSFPWLLNFTMGLDRFENQDRLIIDTQSLELIHKSDLIEAILDKIPISKHTRMKISNTVNPLEPGSLLKRIIVDKRGKDA